MQQSNDESLLKELKAGRKEAFNEIYLRYQKQLFLYAYYKLRNLQEAEDVLQEIFTSLWKRRAKLDDSKSLKHYLYSALRNKCVDNLRKVLIRNSYMRKQPLLEEPVTFDNSTFLENKELLLQIKTAIGTIPYAQKRAFEMAYLEQKSHKEIMAETGTSLQTVKNNISTALKTLRKKLQNIHND